MKLHRNRSQSLPLEKKTYFVACVEAVSHVPRSPVLLSVLNISLSTYGRTVTLANFEIATLSSLLISPPPSPCTL